MSFISILFFIYFMFIFLFSLVSHPVYYCGFLVINSLICSLICYLIFGFSWYPLLFCLVYIGGVYILFVFVSVHSPNSNHMIYYNLNNFSLLLLTLVCSVIGYILVHAVVNTEFSSFLCTIVEGNIYVAMCLTLLFGFIILSFIMSVKLNYYR